LKLCRRPVYPKMRWKTHSDELFFKKFFTGT